MNDFSKKLRSILIDMEISQAELSEKTGLTQATISRYLNGKMVPTGDKLYILSKTLNVSVDYMLGISDNKKINLQKSNSNVDSKNFTLVAHRTNRNESDIRDIEDLKDLIRQVISEEKNK